MSGAVLRGFSCGGGGRNFSFQFRSSRKLKCGVYFGVEISLNRPTLELYYSATFAVISDGMGMEI